MKPLLNHPSTQKKKRKKEEEEKDGEEEKKKKKKTVGILCFADFVTMLFYSMNQQPWKECSMKILLKYSVCLRVQITVLFSSNCLSVPMLKTILNLSSVNFKLISVGF